MKDCQTFAVTAGAALVSSDDAGVTMRRSQRTARTAVSRHQRQPSEYSAFRREIHSWASSRPTPHCFASALNRRRRDAQATPIVCFRWAGLRRVAARPCPRSHQRLRRHRWCDHRGATLRCAPGTDPMVGASWAARSRNS